MNRIKEDIISLVHKSVQTLNSIEKSERQLTGLEALTLMRRDLACNRIKEALHQYQVKISAIAAKALGELTATVRAQQVQLDDERNNLTGAKRSLLVMLEESKVLATAPLGSFDVERAMVLRTALRQIVENDYTPQHWDVFTSLEFVMDTGRMQDISLGYLRTSALDPQKLSLTEDVGQSDSVFVVGQEVSLNVNNEDEFRIGWEDCVEVSVTGPAAKEISYSYILTEGDHALKLCFKVEHEGRYTVDVKAYNAHIQPCPITFWAIGSGQMTKGCRLHMIDTEPTLSSKNNSTMPLHNSTMVARGDEAAEPEEDKSAFSSQASRAYGPRAARCNRTSGTQGNNACLQDAFDVAIPMDNLSMDQPVWDATEFGTPIIIQPEELTSMKDAINIKEEPNDCAMDGVITRHNFEDNTICSSKVDLEASPGKTSSIEATETSPTFTTEGSSQLADKNTSFNTLSTTGKSPTKERMEESVSQNETQSFGNGSALLGKSTSTGTQKTWTRNVIVMGNGDGSEDVSDLCHEVLLDGNAVLAAVKKTQSFCSESGSDAAQESPPWNRTVTMEHGNGVQNLMDIPLPSDPFPGEAETLSFSFLSNVINLHFGRAIPARITLNLGKHGTGIPYGFSFPIGVTTTKAGSHPDIVMCDTGNNLVKIFSWAGTFKMALGAEESDVSFKRPSSVVTNAQGDIFVKDDRMIYKFSATGSLLMQIGKRILQKPYGLKMTDDGELVTLDHRLKAIVIFSEANGVNLHVIPFAPLEARDSRFRFMAIHGGRIIAVNLGQHELVIGCLKTGQVLSVVSGLGHAPGQFNEPSGVTTDTHSNMLVADSRNNRIQVFDMDGNYLTMLSLDEKIVRPSDIHLTDDGYLLVDSYLQHTIKVFKLG